MTGLVLEPRYPAGSYVAQSRWLHGLGLMTVPPRSCATCWLAGGKPCAHSPLNGPETVVYARKASAGRARVLLVADGRTADLLAAAVVGVTVTIVDGPAGHDGEWSLLVREGGGA